MVCCFVPATSSSLTIRSSDDEITSTTSNLSSLSIHPHLQARNPTMVSQAARMKSFDGWPPGLAQRPLQLASAGFFYMSKIIFHLTKLNEKLFASWIL